MKNRIVAFAMLFSLLSIGIMAGNRKFTVVIDPGHGGKDPGATRAGVSEASINLAVSLLVGEMLEKHQDIKVAYTRKTDRSLEPQERMNIANRAEGDIFVSVHVNSAYNEKKKKDVTSTHGVEVYIQTVENTGRKTTTLKQKGSVTTVGEDGKEIDRRFDSSRSQAFQAIYEIKQAQIFNLSNNLARYIGQELGAEDRNMRGVKQQSLYVTWQTITPSVLIEIGYITNEKERNFMSSKSGQRSIATGIYNGILKYKKDFDQSREGFSQSGKEYPVEINTPLKEEAKAQETIKESETADKKESKEVVMDNKEDVVFAWQIFSTSEKLVDSDYRFKGLRCKYYRQGGMLKYIYGSSSSYSEVKSKQKEVQRLFPDAFIIALKGGERVDINKVRK